MARLNREAMQEAAMAADRARVAASAAALEQQATEKGFSSASEMVAAKKAEIKKRRRERKAANFAARRQPKPSLDRFVNDLADNNTPVSASGYAGVALQAVGDTVVQSRVRKEIERQAAADRAIKSSKEYPNPPKGTGKPIAEPVNTSTMLDEQSETAVRDEAAEARGNAVIERLKRDDLEWATGGLNVKVEKNDQGIPTISGLSDEEIQEAGGVAGVISDRRPDTTGTRGNRPRPVLRARIGAAYNQYGATSDQIMVPPTRSEIQAGVELTRAETRNEQNKRAYIKKKNEGLVESQLVALRESGNTEAADILESAGADSSGPSTSIKPAGAAGTFAYTVKPANAGQLGTFFTRSSNAEARKAFGGLSPNQAALAFSLVESKNKRINKMMTSVPHSAPVLKTRVVRATPLPDNVTAVSTPVLLSTDPESKSRLSSAQARMSELSGIKGKEADEERKALSGTISSINKKRTQKVSTYVVKGQEVPITRRMGLGDYLKSMPASEVASASGYAKVALSNIANIYTEARLSQSRGAPVGNPRRPNAVEVRPEAVGVESGGKRRVYPDYNMNRSSKDFGKKLGTYSVANPRSYPSVASAPVTVPGGTMGSPAFGRRENRAMRQLGDAQAFSIMSGGMSDASGYGKLAQSGIAQAQGPRIAEYQEFKNRSASSTRRTQKAPL